MKIYFIAIVFLTVQFAYGQSANQKDIIEILNLALLQGELPDELINKSNPEFAPWTNAPFIVVKSDTSNYHAGDSTHVWIFADEQIFLYDIGYGLVPIRTTRKQGARRLRLQDC